MGWWSDVGLDRRREHGSVPFDHRGHDQPVLFPTAPGRRPSPTRARSAAISFPACRPSVIRPAAGAATRSSASCPPVAQLAARSRPRRDRRRETSPTADTTSGKDDDQREREHDLQRERARQLGARSGRPRQGGVREVVGKPHGDAERCRAATRRPGGRGRGGQRARWRAGRSRRGSRARARRGSRARRRRGAGGSSRRLTEFVEAVSLALAGPGVLACGGGPSRRRCRSAATRGLRGRGGPRSSARRRTTARRPAGSRAMRSRAVLERPSASAVSGTSWACWR